MREGQELTIDGTLYTATQTVIDRREFTYENMLTIAAIDASTVGTYSCSVMNTLGTSQTVEVEVPAGESLDCYRVVVHQKWITTITADEDGVIVSVGLYM